MGWLRDPKIVLTAVCGLALALCFVPGLSWLAYVSVAAGSYFALKSAWGSLMARELDVNLLMVLAAIGAIVVGHVEDAAALLFLFSLSGTLESLAMAKTRSAIEGLIHLRPDKAIRVGPSGDEEVRTEDLKKGDIVRVLPYQQVPTDGIVLRGLAQIDESAMTGESRPIEKSEGDPLMAGTQNLDTMLLMSVTTEVQNSTLEKIVQLVEEAQENKASGERISLWFGQRYTVFVLAAFVVALVARLAIGSQFSSALYGAIILLVALSPCALVISTPATTLSALAFAARNGVLVRGGQYIEAAGRIDSVVVDKTGTLTEGKPRVVEICVGLGWSDEPDAARCPTPQLAGGGVSCGEVCKACTCIKCWRTGDRLRDESAEALKLAAAAESHSTHPIAEAIVAAAREQGLEFAEPTSHQAHSGLGITAEVHGSEVKIGQRRFFEAQGEFLPGGFKEHVEDIQKRGLTAVLLRYQDKFACVALQDQPRPNADRLLQGLREAGVRRVVMMTGDNEQTARAVADQLGIEEYHAGLIPQEKAEKIAHWIGEGRQVMMIGDGVNDAPSLALATVGVAMGGLGSDVALKAADVVLVQDRIERIPQLMRLGKMSNRVIRANLLFASGMILALTVLSMVWTSIPWLRSLAPAMPLPMAVIGHEGSTVLVILNGLRLLRGPG